MREQAPSDRGNQVLSRATPAVDDRLENLLLAVGCVRQTRQPDVLTRSASIACACLASAFWIAFDGPPRAGCGCDWQRRGMPRNRRRFCSEQLFGRDPLVVPCTPT